MWAICTYRCHVHSAAETSIPLLYRSMPLTAAGGANAVNSTNGEAASTADSKEQSVKKPKAQDKLKTAAAVAKKRGLKRL